MLKPEDIVQISIKRGRTPRGYRLLRESAHHARAAADFADDPLKRIICLDLSPVIGWEQEVSERFCTVEKHVRGKWVCRRWEQLIQAPVPPQVIDKGIPTAGLLAQVLIAKYLDHLPLYRQESIFGRARLALPRSTLAQWISACGVRLAPPVEAMKAQLLTRPVLHAGERPCPC